MRFLMALALLALLSGCIQDAMERCQTMEGSESKDRCYESYAMAVGNDSICKNIETLEYKDDCYNHVSSARNEPRLCEKVNSETKRDSCYLAFAKQGNVGLCDMIQSVNNRDMCYWDVASATKDSSICSKIHEPVTMESCSKHCCGL